MGGLSAALNISVGALQVDDPVECFSMTWEDDFQAGLETLVS